MDPSRPVRVCSPCFQDLSGGRRFTFDVLATAGFSVRTVLKVRGRVLDQINPLRHNVISSSCCSSISNNGTAVNAHITGNKKCPESPPPYQLSIGGVNFNDQIEGRTKRSVSFVSPSDETNTRGSIIGAETGQQSIISCNRQNCKLCYEAFSMFRVKTTCMNCGFNVCRDCSPNKFLIPSIDVKSEVRVCLVCYESLSNACFDYRPSEALTMSSLGTTTRSSLYLGAGINGRGSLCEGFVPGSATNKIGNNDDGGSMSKRRVGRVATSVTVVSVVRQSCKVCLQEFNFIKNIRCECDHW